MAMPDVRRVLCIRVLEDSEKCEVFVIRVSCGEPRLLRFWSMKPAFCNGQVEQTDAKLHVAAKMDFTLRVIHAAPNLHKSHYWGPFVLELCLDAHPFGFHLPAQAQCGIDVQHIIEKCGQLTLQR